MVYLSLLEWLWGCVMHLPLSKGLFNWSLVLTYLDDLNVIGKSFRDHLDNLVMSFGRLREYNLKMKPRKCFFQKEVPFPGKLATTEGRAIDPNKSKLLRIALSQLVEGK